MKKEKQCLDYIPNFNPIHFMFREDVDEYILTEMFYGLVCLDNLMDCCCDVNMNDIYIMVLNYLKYFGEHFKYLM